MSEIQNYTRQLLIDYLHDNKVTLNKIANDLEISQPNLYVFMNGKGLSVKNLEKLWKFFGLKLTK